jgi:hypothetical protein
MSDSSKRSIKDRIKPHMPLIINVSAIATTCALQLILKDRLMLHEINKHAAEYAANWVPQFPGPHDFDPQDLATMIHLNDLA